MTTRHRTKAVLAGAALVGWPLASAYAQNVDNPPPAEAPKPPAAASQSGQAPATGPPSSPEAPPTATLPTPPGQNEMPATVFAAPNATAKARRQKRARALETTVGMLPPEPDFGSEADLVSTADEDAPPTRPKKWVYSMRGFLRAPMRVGIGPRNDNTGGQELHSLPRIIGIDSDDWNYVGLAPAPTALLHVNVSNANVSGNLILAASTFADSGYKNLDQIGGVSQGYVTISSPELFGKKGGLAWTVGSFSNRYGVAGPNQNSTGYYGTYLFGRTHVAGEALTVDYDLTDDLQLVVEHGIGAKLEVVPFINLNHNPAAPRANYLPDQGPVPLGSNYVHHAHAALIYDDWLRVAAHYMTSWTPNDQQPVSYNLTGTPQEGRLTVVGGEVHVDSPSLGNGFVGYSHVDAKRVLPLADGIQVIHGSSGLSFKQNYFGRLVTTLVAGNPAGTQLVGFAPPAAADDTGTVDTVEGQYILKLSTLLGTGAQGPDAALAVFGMLNHVKAFNSQAGKDVTVDKYKFGAELEVTPLRILSAGVRFDMVAPDGHNADVTYSAISPRVIIHTNWLSREYVIINYTRYFLGNQVYPTPANWYQCTTKTTQLPNTCDPNPYPQADNNLITLSVAVSF